MNTQSVRMFTWRDKKNIHTFLVVKSVLSGAHVVLGIVFERRTQSSPLTAFSLLPRGTYSLFAEQREIFSQ